MEPLHARDQVFRLAEGWFFVVSNLVYGVWTSEEAAQREMEQQQQAELDLHRSKLRGYVR